VQRSASIELGPYQLLERIGEGGSGQVYRARGPSGPVAVKILGPATDLDDAARARFRREIGALGQIAHPHLISLVDHGIDAELGPYLVVPLLAGTNLRALCGGKSLCPEAALLLVQPIAAATAALHAAGYIHRDLKPENVIAGPDGAVTVIDLGLAWRDGMTRHTDTGAVVGSVGYMAPEQVEGHAVDNRADIWALGVMVFEWIAGKRPFARARPAEEAAAVLVGACARLTAADRRASSELADVVARCLAIDPARRPSAPDLVAALAGMVDWTDDPASERAAVIADPVAYQQRIAPFRVHRLERQAHEAIDAGKPFAALAACDRGLAYSPNHAGLLALVAQAERATGDRPRSETDGADDEQRRDRTDDDLRRARADARATGEPRVASTNDDIDAPRATAAPSEPTRKRAPRWPWFVVGAAGIVAGAAITYALIPDRHDPWASTPSAVPTATTTTSRIDDRDRELMHDFVSVFGRALDERSSGTAPPVPNGPAPTTARGWLDLAATQEPADAVASIRQALQLSPGWLDAQLALCASLVAAKDDGALGACNVALRRKPNDPTMLGARGAAYLQAGKPADAIADLDRVIAVDPDPRWRRLRAHAKTATGDRSGAAHDLAAACQLGDAPACKEAP
jgi:tetratricopeptide (TPR) repeat protein